MVCLTFILNNGTILVKNIFKNQTKENSWGKKNNTVDFEKITIEIGRRQVVRHRVLVPTSGGSNPSALVIQNNNITRYTVLEVNQRSDRSDIRAFLCLFCNH